MAGFAYYIPRTEKECSALRNLMIVANEAAHYAKTIGLFVNDEDGQLFFEKLWQSLSNHMEKEFYDDGSDL